jgi:hypothetical protein
LGHTSKFITAYVIKNQQQPILSRQVLRKLGMILRQARAERGKRFSAAMFLRIKLGQRLHLNKIANEFQQFFHSTKVSVKSGLAGAVLMFQNTPRSLTVLSPAQLIFGRNLMDSILFSRQMLHPQN